MGSTSTIPDRIDPIGLFINFKCFRSLTQNEEEPLETFASRVTQQSLLIGTFCDADRVLQAKNQVLWGMRSTVIREEALNNNWTLEEFMKGKKINLDLANIKTELPESLSCPEGNEFEDSFFENKDQDNIYQDADVFDEKTVQFFTYSPIHIKGEIEENGSVNNGNERGKHHKCSSCDMEFYNSSELVKHTKAIHEMSQDFKCKYCGRLFCRKFVMVQHIKSAHTFEKKHKCSICGKTYISKYHLTRHVKEAHEHYKRNCDICNKRIAGYGSGNLNKHKKAVHGVV
uniref:C2H2-type domain-containing protein n=2 Tax=Lepeophtheirus salmonis TaxID=72036 RepID=A0A0K2US13_LEPSM